MDTETLLDELEHGPLQVEQMSFDSLVFSSENESSASYSPHGPVTGRNGKAAAKTQAIVTGRHQDTRLFVAVMLKTFVEMTDAGLVREAPFRLWLDNGRIYEPDVVFVSSSNLDRVQETHIKGAADMVIEVLSEESTALDRGEKFVAYETAGVREYWLVDPLRNMVNVYLLGPDGRFDEIRPDTAGRLRSRVLKGFLLDTNLLWRKLLPTTVESVEMIRTMVGQR